MPQSISTDIFSSYLCKFSECTHSHCKCYFPAQCYFLFALNERDQVAYGNIAQNFFIFGMQTAKPTAWAQVGSNVNCVKKGCIVYDRNGGGKTIGLGSKRKDGLDLFNTLLYSTFQTIKLSWSQVIIDVLQNIWAVVTQILKILKSI